ncbi:MAG: tRNA pseudouridine(54/55) synthase Pus10 [Candidatus Bathyarchaeia archaeon]
MEEILKMAEKLVEAHALCDNCLGRQFASLASGASNAERGRSLKNTLVMAAYAMIIEGKRKGRDLLKKLASNGFSDFAKATLEKLSIQPDAEPRECEVCKGKLEEIDALATEAISKAEGYEFHSFLVGAKIPSHVTEAEDSLRAKHGVNWGEAIRSEFTREIGKIISHKTMKKVNYTNPDVNFTVDPYKGEVTLQVNPLFIAGRYKKLKAGIPQSRWLCNKCRGKGCPSCGGTGRRYEDSVQEIIAQPILMRTMGEDAILHASGREDVDAKVLGEGRPFVLEVKRPRIRSLKLEEVRDAIAKSGKVEVEDLQVVGKDYVKKLKMGESADKVYQAIVEVDGEITDDDLEKVSKVLTGCYIKQATPSRVLHRRVDKVRERYIYKVNVKKISAKSFDLTIHCQGGLYVKELVEGDEGRTTPSVATLIGKKARCVELNVLDVGRRGAS